MNRDHHPDPADRTDPSNQTDPEALLRGLHFRSLPESWRAEILSAALENSESAGTTEAESEKSGTVIPATTRPAFQLNGSPSVCLANSIRSSARPCLDALPARAKLAWFRRPLFQGLAAAWTVIAALRLTTPSPSVLTPAQLLAMPGSQGMPFPSSRSLTDFEFASVNTAAIPHPVLPQP